jgi:signal peptidase I
MPLVKTRHYVILGCLSLVLLALLGSVRVYRVPTESMRPTILAGQRILVQASAYDLRVPFVGTVICRLGDPSSGDVVVYVLGGRTLVKRVFAVPGEVVEWPDNEITVPEGHYFVLGDDELNSFDSRMHGPVPRSDIIGRMMRTLGAPERPDGP